jgi:hypothetical protein
MSPKSAEGRFKGVLCFNLKFAKNAPRIGQRPIKESFMFLIKICEKNQPQLGRRPITGSFMF